MLETTPDTQKTPLLVRVRRRVPVLYDLMMGFVYFCFVHVWGLWVQPLGRDFELLSARAAAVVEPPVAWLLRMESEFFGANVLPYHLLNAALLFACIVCVYWIVQLAIQGPYWLAALGATLFMAHPLHAESTLNLAGAADLLPALPGLAAVALYLAHARKGGKTLLVLALLMMALAVGLFRANTGLFVALLAAELFLFRSARCHARIVPTVAIGAAGLWLHHKALITASFSLQQTVEPLYFAVYPLGFLPETVERALAYPVLSWMGVAAALAVLAFILRKAKRPELPFAIVAMFGCRALVPGREIDLVHLTGGGQLILPLAMGAVGVVALAHEIAKHPKWRATAIYGTTFLCLLLFTLHIRESRAWQRAGDAASGLRAEASAVAARGERVVIIPDYQHYSGAPLCLSAGLKDTTVFGPAIDCIALLKLNHPTRREFRSQVEVWDSENIRLRFEAATPLEVLPLAYTLDDWRKGVPYQYATSQEEGTLRVRLESEEKNGFVLALKAMEGPLPPPPATPIAPNL